MAEKVKQTADTSGLDTFGKGDFGGPLTCESVWKLYERALAYNASIDLNETVRVNENFFIGKQWEGAVSNGLPTPVFNVLKRVCCFTVATISSDNIKIQATPLAATPNTQGLLEPARIINEELEALTERNRVPSLMREYARNAAVDGDGCTYTWWDPDMETGQDAKGGIRTEIIENTRVHFGNPNDRHVESQPYIILERRDMVGAARRQAKDNGVKSWDAITADCDNAQQDSAKQTSDKVTTILLLWRDRKTREIWAFQTARTGVIKEPWNLGIRRYPITWLNWDYIQDCYHGQAMITGLIPNQIFINKAWAMSQLSLMTTAYPKVLYDSTRVGKWDNRIGAAIGINGGDVNSVAKIMDPATISPQVAQFIQLAVEQTEQSLGATSVALGDTRPDNTSAIIALQRAAATPSEITKQNLYQSIEDLYRIYIEFMAEYYGKRAVDVSTPPLVREAVEFIGQNPPSTVLMPFDFKTLKDMPMSLKLDVGASSYYSEIASIQTLDNLLRMNKITTLQYLERIPDGYIPARRELIDQMKEQEAAAARAAQAAQMGGAQNGGSGPVAGEMEKPEIPTGGGYSALQRKVNETGSTEGMV